MRRLLALGLRGAKRLSGFALNQLLLGVASLVLMPAVIGSAGLNTWSSIVLAQALAQVVATLVGCGYGVNGPAVVATLTTDDGVRYFRIAERVRFVIAVPCFALMIGAMFIIPNPDPIAGLLGGAHIAIGAFSATFFYVGRSAPRWQLFAEICPRVALMLAGAICLVLGAPLLVGLALPAVGALVAVAVSNSTIRLSAKQETQTRVRLEIASIRSEMRNQLGPAASSILRGGRDALPVLVVTAIAAELVGAFGVFDRLVRQALGVMSSVTATLQGWVPRRIAAEGGTRPAVAAMVVGFGIAGTVVLLFAWFGSPVIRWLAAGTIQPTVGEVLVCGGVIATGIMIQIVAYACLVPLGAIRGVIWSALVGIFAILIACPLMLSIERSVLYALGALAIGNTVQILAQLSLMKAPIAKELYAVWRKYYGLKRI